MIDLLAFLGGELRPEDQRPVVEPFADDLRTELVGGGLQRRDVVDSKKGIVGLAKADLPPLQFLLDETVTIEVIAGLEREEGDDPHHDWTEDRIADVEVVMREAAALVRQDPVFCLMTPPAYRSGISVRQQPRDPFVRAVPMVRIRFPPAVSLQNHRFRGGRRW